MSDTEDQQVPLEQTEDALLINNEQQAELQVKKSYIKLIFIVPFFLLLLLTIAVFFLFYTPPPPYRIRFTELQVWTTRRVRYEQHNGAAVPVFGVGTLNWHDPLFNDSSWNTTSARIDQQSTRFTSVYLRCNIPPLKPLPADAKLYLVTSFASGFAAWVNGQKVASANLGDPEGYVFNDGCALNFQKKTPQSTVAFSLGLAETLLNTGYGQPNRFAAVVQRYNLDVREYVVFPSPDIYFSFQLFAANDQHQQTEVLNDTAICKTFVGYSDPANFLDPIPPPPRPDSTNRSVYRDGANWIELFNAGKDLNISGWTLRKGDDPSNVYTFANDTVFRQGEYLVIFTDKLDYTGEYIHTNFNVQPGDTIAVYDHQSYLATKLVIRSDASRFYTIGVVEDGQQLFQRYRSPGQANVGEVFYDLTAAPVFSQRSGLFDKAFTLVISSHTDPVNIYYTLDGSDPNETSLHYTAPIEIAANVTVRAIAYGSYYLPSEITAETYLVGLAPAFSTVPCVMVAGDPVRSLFAPGGVTTINGGVRRQDNYGFQEWFQSNGTAYSEYNILLAKGSFVERPSHLSIAFPASMNQSLVTAKLGIRYSASAWSRPRNFGTDLVNWSASEWGAYGESPYKPAFNLYAKNDYSLKSLNNFVLNTKKNLRSFRLRSGKNDLLSPFIKDEFLRRLYAQTGESSVLGFFCSLFVNGKYRGYYNLVERIDDNWCKQQYAQRLGSNVTAFSFDILKQAEWESGTNEFYMKTVAFMRANSPLADASYRTFVTNYIDVDNFIAYLILNCWGGNTDWPRNNYYLYRLRGSNVPCLNGRWKFGMWDAEMIFVDVSFNNVERQLYRRNLFDDTGKFIGPVILEESIETMFTYLLFSQLFKDRWREILGPMVNETAGGVLTPANLNRTWYSLSDQIQPLMKQTNGRIVDDTQFRSFLQRRTVLFCQQLEKYGLCPFF